MIILAFETSCDDTAVAIVENGTKVLANVRTSQPEHDQYGGVVPEVAARLHSEHWREVLGSALAEAKLQIKDIDYLAVTQGPGLQTSLLIGTTAASFLSLLFQKPLIPVHHIFGHICSVFLERDLDTVKFPALSLTVSGGHTDVYLWESILDFKKIGGTRDDAAGEAFDKVAKMLGLGYPGGPIVSSLAVEGDEKAYDFPRPMLEKDSLDFSFSGVKAAVYRTTNNEQGANNNTEKLDLDSKTKADICASFQAASRDIFVKKIERAFLQFPDIKTLCFVGGVSANTEIRSALEKISADYAKDFLTTSQFIYCTDNAAMIGSAAYFLVRENLELGKVQYVDGEPRKKI